MFIYIHFLTQYKEFTLNPQKWRIPLSKISFISTAATKPIIARRPFYISACMVKPTFQVFRSSIIGSVIVSGYFYN